MHFGNDPRPGDGIPIIAEKDEFVVNRNAYRRFKPLIDTMNNVVAPRFDNKEMAHSAIDEAIAMNFLSEIKNEPMMAQEGGEVGLQYAEDYEYSPSGFGKILDALPFVGDKRAYDRAEEYRKNVHWNPEDVEFREAQDKRGMDVFGSGSRLQQEEDDISKANKFQHRALTISQEDPRNFTYRNMAEDNDLSSIDQFIIGSPSGHIMETDNTEDYVVDPYNIAKSSKNYEGILGMLGIPRYSGSVEKNPGIEAYIDPSYFKEQVMQTDAQKLQQGGEVAPDATRTSQMEDIFLSQKEPLRMTPLILQVMQAITGTQKPMTTNEKTNRYFRDRGPVLMDENQPIFVDPEDVKDLYSMQIYDNKFDKYNTRDYFMNRSSRAYDIDELLKMLNKEESVQDTLMGYQQGGLIEDKRKRKGGYSLGVKDELTSTLDYFKDIESMLPIGNPESEYTFPKLQRESLDWLKESDAINLEEALRNLDVIQKSYQQGQIGFSTPRYQTGGTISYGEQSSSMPTLDEIYSMAGVKPNQEQMTQFEANFTYDPSREGTTISSYMGNLAGNRQSGSAGLGTATTKAQELGGGFAGFGERKAMTQEARAGAENIYGAAVESSQRGMFEDIRGDREAYTQAALSELRRLEGIGGTNPYSVSVGGMSEGETQFYNQNEWYKMGFPDEDSYNDWVAAGSDPSTMGSYGQDPNAIIGNLGITTGLSDRRLKKDVNYLFTMDNNVPIYTFKYNWSDDIEIGTMAQDLEDIIPEAVSELNGYKLVDYKQVFK